MPLVNILVGAVCVFACVFLALHEAGEWQREHRSGKEPPVPRLIAGVAYHLAMLYLVFDTMVQYGWRNYP